MEEVINGFPISRPTPLRHFFSRHINLENIDGRHKEVRIKKGAQREKYKESERIGKREREEKKHRERERERRREREKKRKEFIDISQLDGIFS